jgi:hypothetical protein
MSNVVTKIAEAVDPHLPPDLNHIIGGYVVSEVVGTTGARAAVSAKVDAANKTRKKDADTHSKESGVGSSGSSSSSISSSSSRSDPSTNITSSSAKGPMNGKSEEKTR